MLRGKKMVKKAKLTIKNSKKLPKCKMQKMFPFHRKIAKIIAVIFRTLLDSRSRPLS